MIKDTLNKYFATIGDKLASNIPEAQVSFSTATFHSNRIIPQEVKSNIITQPNN